MAPFCGSNAVVMNAVVMSSFLAADGSRRLTRRARRGVTLVELLVVISILLILTTVAVPMMQPALENRRTREAARALHVYLGSARIRAMERGRPVGVIFERLPEQAEGCRVLRQAEVPPPYAGDFVNSRIHIQPNLGTMSATVSFPMNDAVAGMIQPGDLLRLNYQGHFWQIVSIGGGGVWQFSSQTAAFPPGLNSSGAFIELPFQVFRQPVPSAAAPLQLPAGVVVDLVASGSDNQPSLPPASAGDRTPVVVMFSPNGSIDRVYYNNIGSRVTEPLFFLVGKWGRMPLTVGGGPSAEDGLLNWQDATNLWVALTPQTGLVTVAPLFADQLNAANTYVPSSIDKARDYARQAQVSKGGR